MVNRPITVSITPSTVFFSVLIVLGFCLAFFLRDLILVVITAVVLASALEPATKRLMRWGVPRVLSVVLLYVSIIGVMSTVFYFFLPPLLRETNTFLSSLPMYLETLRLEQANSLLNGTQGSFASELLRYRDVLTSSSSGILSAASSIFGGLLSFILIVVLSFYFAVQETGIDDFLRLVTPLPKHEYVLDLWRRAQHKIGRWLQGQLLLSLIVGVLVFVGLSLLHVRYAFLLALAAAVLELIPVFGSILAAVPAVVIGFVDGGTTLALLTIVMYVIVNQLEGNVIYPMVVQKVLGVPPLIVIIAIIAGAQLGGFLGIVIAVPIAAAVQEYINDVQKKKRENGEIDDSPDLDIVAV